MYSDASSVATLDRKSTPLNSSPHTISYSLFSFNDTATTEIYPLSLHDALPISGLLSPDPGQAFARVATLEASLYMPNQLLRDPDWSSMAHSLEARVPQELIAHVQRRLERRDPRSEEHTSELQSPHHLLFPLFF